MTIWRGEGGGGDATTDSEINLITALANSITADKAITTAAADSATASASEALTLASNAATSATNADISAVDSAASAAASLSSANNSASSAAAALVSENAAAASAASVNDTNLVHITGTETITGTKTFSNTITGSITGNSGTVTNGVYTSGDQTIGGNKTFSNTILGSISGATGVFTGDIQATSQNGGQLAGLRNKIINGNMGIFQRGTAAVTTSLAYGPADRWQNEANGDTFSTTQGVFASGDTLYDTGGAQYFTTIAVTSVAGVNNFVRFQQQIEDVRILAGQTVTVSFWAKAATGTPSIGMEILQNFGTGGSPSAITTGVGQSQALTTTWTKYSKTFTFPSINGKTIGTDVNSSYSRLLFWLDAGATYATRSGSIGQSSKTVSIAQVQLEIGSVATPFEFRPIGMELALCQRYCRSIDSFSTVGQAFSTTGANIFNVGITMRSTPTLSTTAGYAVTTAAGASQAVTAISVGASGNSGAIQLGITVASGLIAGNATYLFTAPANAVLSAEL